jgi:predicted transcriptional regulator
MISRDEYEAEAQAKFDLVIEMKKRGMKQKDIAAELGITASWVSRIIKSSKTS